MEAKCKCEYCKKNITIEVPDEEFYNKDYDCRLGNTCNKCVPENSCARDGMMESTYTEVKDSKKKKENANDKMLKWLKML